MSNPLQKNFSSSIHRNDDELQKRWSSKTNHPVLGVDFTDDPGKTDQSHSHDADINNIVAKYHKTGVFPGLDGPQIFADVSDAPSYQDALQTVINAESAFMALDAKTRREFDNDPSKMLAFLEDPNNRDKAISLGMIDAPPPPPSPAGPDLTGGQPGPLKTKSKAPVAPAGDES